MLLATLGGSLLEDLLTEKELSEVVQEIEKEEELQELVPENNEIVNTASSFNKF